MRTHIFGVLLLAAGVSALPPICGQCTTMVQAVTFMPVITTTTLDHALVQQIESYNDVMLRLNAWLNGENNIACWSGSISVLSGVPRQLHRNNNDNSGRPSSSEVTSSPNSTMAFRYYVSASSTYQMTVSSGYAVTVCGNNVIFPVVPTSVPNGQAVSISAAHSIERSFLACTVAMLVALACL